MCESNLSINMGGHWKAWGEFVETTRGPKVVARSANSCAQVTAGKTCTRIMRTRVNHVILKNSPD